MHMNSFEQAVASGCILCFKFLSYLVVQLGPGFQPLNTERAFSHYTLASSDRGRYVLTLHADLLPKNVEVSMTLKVGSVYPNSYRIRFAVIPQIDDLYYLCLGPKACDIGNSTISMAAWGTALGWYNSCIQSHQKCRRAVGNNVFVPTRVLDLEEAFPDVKLVLKSDLLPNTSYATLSHRWGPADFLQLTKDNMSEMKTRISLAILPKTFIEAIEVTRKLRIRYLWIDSLCIIQDLEDDWQQEAAHMHHVYGRSRINIMATASHNAHEGLFRDRDFRAISACPLTSSWVGEKEEKFVLFDDGLWRNDVAEAPLIRRGWVVQERILPPRALHFGGNQLLWECEELDACEAHPNGIPRIMQDEASLIKTLDPHTWHSYCQQRYNQEGKHKLTFRHPPCPLAYAGYDIWSRIVQYYTRTQLTYGSDALIAISGLATRMRELLDDVYLMGLWLQHLPSQLSWSVMDAKNSSRPEDRRAPSWSWASIDGPVRMTVPQENLVPLVHLKDYLVEPDTDESTKLRLAPYITLEGTLLSSCIKSKPEIPEEYEFQLGGESNMGRSKLKMDMRLVTDMPQVFCLPITITKMPTVTQTIEALILVKATDYPQGCYKRIGTINTERGSGSISEIGSSAPDNEWPMYCAMNKSTTGCDEYYLKSTTTRCLKIL